MDDSTTNNINAFCIKFHTCRIMHTVTIIELESIDIDYSGPPFLNHSGPIYLA